MSYFDLMPDSVLDRYWARGIASRSEMIIGSEYRRANPCTFGQGNPTDWVALR